MRAQCSCRVLTAARACSQLLEHADSCLCPQYATTVSPAAGGYSTTVSPAAGGNARSVLLQSTDSCSCLLAALGACRQLPVPSVFNNGLPSRSGYSTTVSPAAGGARSVLLQNNVSRPWSSRQCPQFSTTVSPAAVAIQQRSPQPQVAMRACSSGRILTAARACSQLLEHADSCLCPQYATTVSPAAGGYSTTVSPAAGGNARSVLLQSTDSCSCLLAALGAC